MMKAFRNKENPAAEPLLAETKKKSPKAASTTLTKSSSQEAKENTHNVRMMKAFINKENPATEPLLAKAKKNSPGARLSSPFDGDDDEVKRGGPLKTLTQLSVPSPLPSLSCQASPAVHAALARNSSTCSTVHTSPGSTPNPSPREQTRKELPLPTPMQHGHSSTVGRRKDPSYRHDHIVSPTAIALKKRSTTLPTYFSSPTLSLEALSLQSYHGGGEGHDDDLPIKKTRSEGISHRGDNGYKARSYDCNYRYSLESAYENFGVERRLVALKQDRSNEDFDGKASRASRGRTCTHPRTSLPPVWEAESRPRPSHDARHASSAHNNSTHKSAPVDIDEFDEEILRRHDEDLKMRRSLSAERARRPSAKIIGSTMTHDSAPSKDIRSESGLERLDAERLLSQMGMDVTEEDYCIEGEFSRRRNHRETKSRCHSYDCNYVGICLERAYEDFGVERQLTELKRPPERLEARDRKKRSGLRVRSVKKIVRESLGSFVGNCSSLDDGRANGVSNRKHRRGNMVHNRGKSSPSNAKINVASKTKVIAKALCCVNRRDGTKEDCRVPIPEQIVATTIITPTNSEDHADNGGCPITPEDMRLLYRWQTARVRGASATDEGIEARITTIATSSGRKNYEDVLSITSSCGDKTAPVDNRRGGRHRQGCSF